MNDFPFEVVPVCTLSMQIDGRVLLGETPEGLRLTGLIAGGTVSGPRLSGRLAKGAADWACIRRDGVLIPEVKLLVETAHGMVQIAYDGVVDMGPDAYGRFQRGERPGTIFHPRTAIRMLTAAPELAWVNRSQFIGIGLLDYGKAGGAIDYDIYELAVPAPAGT